MLVTSVGDRTLPPSSWEMTAVRLPPGPALSLPEFSGMSDGRGL